MKKHTKNDLLCKILDRCIVNKKNFFPNFLYVRDKLKKIEKGKNNVKQK